MCLCCAAGICEAGQGTWRYEPNPGHDQPEKVLLGPTTGVPLSKQALTGWAPPQETGFPRGGELDVDWRLGRREELCVGT
jgi:hypothetical protein